MQLAVSPRLRLVTPDALLAGGVLLVVGFMVVPLPTWLLDLLLSANLLGSTVLLLLTMYVRSPLRIVGFPTLLLLATLVRLGLNVSSTRLVLSQADAGAVIRAFGGYLVSGSYVVGAVIFLILVVIQFVVIAKGAERIAEVSARFTLDALPGKQLGIDAQQRMGSLSTDQARHARARLEKESQFYGAMDGAMKFVKGDVIAGAVITVVNITGGLLIGVLQHGSSVGSALRTYGLLTIGDGLVSQLPALLTATAAGILVTRIASESESGALGSQLAEQLFATPAALRAASVFAVVLAVVPGLPAVPFLVVGALLWGLSLWGRRSQLRSIPRSDALEQKTDEVSFIPEVTRWQVQVAPDLSPWLTDTWSGETVRVASLPRCTERVRGALFERLGVPLPPCAVSVDAALTSGQVRVLLREVPAGTRQAPPTTEREKWFVDFALPLLEARAKELIGVGETRQLLDQLRTRSPAVVEECVPSAISVPKLTEILQLLVDEGVSVRDLRAILETAAAYAGQDLPAVELAERARANLQRALSFQLAGDTNALRVVTLSPELEDTVRGALMSTSRGPQLAIAPAQRRDFVRAVTDAVESDGSVVLLAAADLRRHVRALMRLELPTLRVIAPDELLPNLQIERVAEATVRGV